MESLPRVIGPDWNMPDFSTLSHCPKALPGNIPCRGSDGPLHLPVDSTGIEGEGEWNARGHGGTKRRRIRSWTDEKPPGSRAAECIGIDTGGAAMRPGLLDHGPPEQEIATVTADGAFDTRSCHDGIAARGGAAIIPPRITAKPWKPAAAGAFGAASVARTYGATPATARANGGQCLTPQRDPAHIEARRSDSLATKERTSPPKPRRDPDALRRTAGSAAHGVQP